MALAHTPDWQTTKPGTEGVIGPRPRLRSVIGRICGAGNLEQYATRRRRYTAYPIFSKWVRNSDNCRMTTIVGEMQNSGSSFSARMTSYNRAFGKALRGFRKATKSTQDALASEAGLDRTYISLLELGQRSPTLDTLFALCRALNISLTEMAAAIEAALPPQLDE